MDSRQQPVATSSYYYYYHYPHPHQHSYHDPTLASLAPRPLQNPLQLAGLPGSANQQQQHHAQLSLAPAGFQQQQPFRSPQHHQQHHHHLPLRTRQSSRRARASTTMAFEQQAQGPGMTEDELAELQKASNEYQPETTVCAVTLRLRGEAKAKCNRKRT